MKQLSIRVPFEQRESDFSALDLFEQSPSLVEILRARSRAEPQRKVFTFLGDGEIESEVLTCGALDLRARALAARLQADGLAGERVLLLYPSGLDYIVAFWGCLYAGAVAVPAYPPGASRGHGRVAAIAADARPRVALTTAALLRRLGRRLNPSELGFGGWLTTDGLDLSEAEAWKDPRATPDSLAFLQYTSGSTSLPKGVMIRHGNLLHNERTIQLAFGQGPASIIVGWLPLYHDMGLIGNVLQPLLIGATCVLMSPMAFLERPLRWLQAISRYRGTTSGGPNFAYDLCARRIRPEDRAGLDLSSWSVAFNGAEPVRAETLDCFVEAFAPCGFRREAFFPCYGLAEATLFVSGGDPGMPPAVRTVAARQLEAHRAIEVEAADPEARPVVGCGRAWLNMGVRIVDPATARECPSGEVGEIWVSGPSVAGGYWNRPEETEMTFRATIKDARGEVFLRTGDLGFLSDGVLFVTGHLKDLIIVRGSNHYPQDLELTAERSHPALRPRGGAAFQVETGGGERLVMVHELERRRQGEASAAAEALRRAITEEHDIQIDEVVLVSAGAVPLTSSGKVQRRACRDAWLEGSLPVLLRSVVGHEVTEDSPKVEDLGREELLTLARPARRAALIGDLRGRVARILRIPGAALNPAGPLAAAGLDSLGAAELQGELSAIFGVPLSLPDLLEGGSIERLAEEILERLESPESPEAEEELPPPIGARQFPLSHGQRALWFIDRLAPASAAYNIAAAARVRTRIDTEALGRALAGVVAIHPELRVTFHEEDGEPVQTLGAVPSVSLLEIDARGWSLDELRRRLAEEALRPFDLIGGPLLRLTLFRSENGEHALLFAVHHLVSDFQSLALVLRDLGDLYDGRKEAAEPSGRGYADYVAWQERRLAGAGSQRLWDYWLGQLAGDLRPLDLSTDRLRPAVQTWRGGSRRLCLTPDLSQRLRALARERGCTAFVLLLAAFQALLFRYSGQRTVIVGSPAAGRTRAAWREMVGYFANPLPLRADLGGELAFGDLLAQVRRTVLQGLEYQDLPFPLLAERLQPQRDPSRAPVFQAMFVFQGPDPPGLKGLSTFALGEEGSRVGLGGLELEQIGLADEREPFDLSLAAAEAEDGFHLSLRFNRDLFDATTAIRLLGHFATLLRGAVREVDRGLGELPLLTMEERFQATVEWSSRTLPWPRNLLLHQLFQEQARRAPEQEAVIGREGSLTYGELAQRATALARCLARLGVGPEVRVGICLQRTPNLVAALLGVLEAGGAYVPLDPAYPPERLGFMLRDARVSVVITDRPSAAALPEGAAQRLFLDEPLPWAAGNPVSAAPGNLAYLIYTSGSTGLPKGVAIEHQAAVSFLSWAGEAFALGELAGVLASTSICFDLSVFELFVPLARGGTVILADSVLDLPELPAAPRVTLINTVPSALAELLRSGPLPAVLATVNLAGEPLAGALADAILARPGVHRLLNLYGPSEDTTYSTWAAVGPERSGPPAIGRPLANGRAYVCDARLEPLPVGIAGELFLGGPGLARGYLDRPELTAERFLPDPFSDEPGGRLYRAGDLARFRPDGELDFVGRADHQVKVRGFRVEIGEVEATIRAHPRVREAVVVADRGPAGDLRLVAYWVREDGEAAAADLRALLRDRLPSYMIPALWVEVDELPRTPNGKVDRRALPAPEPARKEWAGASHGPVEDLLAELWVGLLGRRPQPDESFFDLGGHSLLALRLVSRVRGAFDVEIGPAAVLETPTLAGLTARIEAALGAGRSTLPPLQAVLRGGELPLSFAQQRLWFLDQLEPGNPAYLMSAALGLRGPLLVPALEGALTALIHRHEALRTIFPAPAGQPQQLILQARPVSLPQVDLAGLVCRQRDTEARRIEAAEAAVPFDLTAGPLARFRLLRLGEEEHVLLAAFHHIVFDGWSMEIFARELGALYAALAGGGPAADLPPLPVQYADYAIWQRSWLSGDALAERLAYWKARLAGAPAALELPLDRPRPAARSSRGSAETVILPAALAAALSRLSRPRRVTRFMVFLAAFQSLLARWTGQDDARVGVPVAGRPRHELENLLGFFVNMLVLRSDLSASPSFSDLLERTRRSTLEAYVHQDLPFELLVETLQPERDLSRQPLFEVVAAQGAALPTLSLPGLQATVEETECRVSRFDLSAILREEMDGAATLTFEYSTDLFTAATVRRLLRHFEAHLADAAAHPGQPCSELALLTPEERHQLLVEGNDTACSPDPAGCVHELFAEQARQSPERLAVAAGARRITYGELDARADRLARSLRACGGGASGKVGLCVERSLEMLVGALAALKAGAAYVALDPAYPEERLVHALQDSGAAVLLARDPLAARLAERSGIAPLVLDESGAPPAGNRHTPVRPGTGAALDDPAYVIYTSGSTGRPKGVEVGHRSLAYLVAWHQRVYGITAADRVTLLAGPGFDASVWEMWPTLTAGASLHLPDPEVLADPAGLWRWLAQQQVTVSFLPTPLLEAALQEKLPASSLRAVLTGGDRLHRLPRPDLALPLFNHYGPTENTVVTTWDRVAAAEAEPPIGRPIDNARVYLLDRSLQPVPLRVAGELCAAGAGLAQGYLGQPALTAERFIPDPFAGVAGARMFRTGDLARRRIDGRIEFLGRLDHQVKIRGYRIELGEIESVLREHSGVREAVVTAGTADGRGLVAYVVSAGQGADTGELRQFLRSRLPEYMVPPTLCAIAKLPLTANGKVDRAALAVSADLFGTLPEEAEPRNGIEAVLADLWCELLGRERVGVFDSFFELGGHSLQIARLLARVREIFGVELPVRILFEASTIAELATVVARRLIEQDESAIDEVLAEMGMAGQDGVEEGLHG